jgi:hypothetical protein
VGAGGQAESFVVDAQVGFDVGVVVGVNDRDRLFCRRARGQLVGAVEVLGAQAVAAFCCGRVFADFSGASRRRLRPYRHAERAGMGTGSRAPRLEFQRKTAEVPRGGRQADIPDCVF